MALSHWRKAHAGCVGCGNILDTHDAFDSLVSIDSLASLGPLSALDSLGPFETHRQSRA